MRKIPTVESDNRIDVTFKDPTGVTIKSFNTVQEQAQYFRDHPEVGKLFGYVVKKELPFEEQELQKVMKQFITGNGINRLDSATGQRLALERKLIESWSIGYVLTEDGKKYMESLKQ